MQTHYLMLVQDPDTEAWIILVDTTDKAEYTKEYEARKGSNVIGIDTSDFATFA